MKRFALLVMPDEPKRNQTDEYEQRAHLLNEMYGVQIAMSDAQHKFPYNSRQNARVQQQNGYTHQQENNSNETVQQSGSGFDVHSFNPATDFIFLVRSVYKPSDEVMPVTRIPQVALSTRACLYGGKEIRRRLANSDDLKQNEPAQ